MQPITPSPSTPEYKGQEQYGLRGSEMQRTTMTQRNATRQAAFLLPHLRPGMSLLDCGCGPGSITIDLAQIVTPGQVIGIDNDPDEIERATTRAAELGVTNVEFKTANAYNLPFADNTFDAVFSNALLDHLSDPLAVLREMYRVLKPGGVVGVRTADRDGYMMAPNHPLIEKWFQEGEAWKAAQGVSVRIGKNLRRFLREAGFVRCEGSASYDLYGTPESVRRISNAAVSSILDDKTGSEADAELDATADAFRQWGESPDSFFAMSFCEGLGWRE